MDSNDNKFLDKALEEVGKANDQAGPSCDGVIGGGVAGDDDDVGKDDKDTLILSSSDEELRRETQRRFNVGRNDDDDPCHLLRKTEPITDEFPVLQTPIFLYNTSDFNISLSHSLR